MKISGKIHCLRIPFKVTDKIERFVNLYIIEGEKIYLIDCGVKGCSEIIEKYLKSINRDISEIKSVILTHTHPDHIGGLYELKSKSDFDLYCPKDEIDWIENIEKQFAERPIPNFYNLVGGSVKVNNNLNDGEIINFENGISLKIYGTKGHSKDSVSIYFEEEGAVFTGDAVPTVENINMPIYISAKESINSLLKIKSIAGIKYMLSAWDIPRIGKECYEVIETAEILLKRINKSVEKLYSKDSIKNMEEFTVRVLEESGIKNGMAIPLVQKSIEANIKEIINL